MVVAKEDCCAASFRLSNESAKKFVSAQWSCLSQEAYLVWRWLAATYFTIWIILSGVWSNWWYISQPEAVKWFVYFTNWSFFWFVLDLIIRAVISLMFYARIFSYGKKCPCKIKLQPFE
ncbi:hypothetical protein CAPTEDRAFT_185069 [Capitella teleta]|uniref:Uncharacterized protein n=1 Tax=Capitella teleta TaxID=283909 RepID=R7VAT1_CAPTE|nr:hypothetical protein CAPTEDRAFT_185069 [Capitella teleta]|eukprot:ELU15689.1 hypothetical protein CAPTEDRAFT_185069 [Capitella teleta]